MRNATITALTKANSAIQSIRSDLEQLQDPDFEEDDSDINEVLDSLQNAADKLEEMTSS